ncbi:MAG TPA: DUF1576 domain-containing protein [Clostridiaceae bacterium]|nr:DUF1576 domain-containing protein [Clostridiaceae bacterium]
MSKVQLERNQQMCNDNKPKISDLTQRENSISGKESDLFNRYNWLICLTLLSAFIILGFSLDTPGNLWKGIIKIVLSSSVLTTDYFAVGGVGAALIHNACFILLLLAIVLISKTKLTGNIMVHIFMPVGFAFFGMNILNILPFVLGVYLYAARQKEPFGKYITNAFNFGSLGPIMSFLALHSGLQLYLSIPLAIVCGTIIGFFGVPFAASCFKLHQGYTLYNTGFTGGFIGILAIALMGVFKIEVIRPNILLGQTSLPFAVFLIVYSVYIFLLGIFLSIKSGSHGSKKSGSYLKLLKCTGYGEVIYDSYGAEITYINMGIMGLLSIGYVLLMGATLTGPVIAGIFSVIGYGVLGKQPFNTIPIILGVTLSGLVSGADLSSTDFVMTGLFGTALAPVTGKFGFIPGFVAGFIHCAIARMTSDFHGGFVLYNNGFASGIVAILLINFLSNLPQNIFRRNNTNY